jgi:hypothetical protein
MALPYGAKPIRFIVAMPDADLNIMARCFSSKCGKERLAKDCIIKPRCVVRCPECGDPMTLPDEPVISMASDDDGIPTMRNPSFPVLEEESVAFDEVAWNQTTERLSDKAILLHGQPMARDETGKYFPVPSDKDPRCVGALQGDVCLTTPDDPGELVDVAAWVKLKRELTLAMPTIPHPGGRLVKVVAHYEDGSTQTIGGDVVTNAVIRAGGGR